MDIDACVGESEEMFVESSHPILALNQERSLRAEKIISGISSRILQQLRIVGEKVNLRLIRAKGETCQSQQVDALLAEMLKHSASLARSVACRHIEIFDYSHCLCH
jgi:hypothetical protein